MFHRLFSALAFILLLFIVLAIYFLYAPERTSPTAPIQEKVIEVAKLQRTYYVFTPSHLKSGASVLLVFHPSMSSGKKIRNMIGLIIENIAEEKNTIVVYPDGYEGHFNDCRKAASFSARTQKIDDVGFTKGIIEKLVAEKAINSRHVYAIGYSNGGHMVLRLAVEHPEMIIGATAIAANFPAPDNMDCKIASPPTHYVAFVEGTKDPLNPYEGGEVSLFGFGSRGNVLSARASAEWLANKLNLFQSTDVKILQRIRGLTARQQDWISSNGLVRLITIDGGGHTIPQANYRFPRLLGPTFQSNTPLESIWEVFDLALQSVG